MLIESYDSNVHDRFDSKSFLGSAFDWTGVGKSGGTWATMISPTEFLSAWHAHPQANDAVTFWLTNLSTGPTVSRAVAGGQRIGQTDLWVGSLVAPVPAEVAIYHLGSPISNLATSLGDYEDRLTYMVGTGGTLSFAVGRNRSDATETTPSVMGLAATFDAIGYFHDPWGTTNSTGNDEALVQAGDSGAPSFIVESGQLKLAGIHSFMAQGIDAPVFSALFDYRTPATNSTLSGNAVRSMSFDVFVPNYAAELSSTAAVPEPAAWAGLSLAAIASLSAKSFRRNPLARLR